MIPITYLITGSNNEEIKWIITYCKFYFNEFYKWVIQFDFSSKYGSGYLSTTGEISTAISEIAQFDSAEEALTFFKDNYINYKKYYDKGSSDN